MRSSVKYVVLANNVTTARARCWGQPMWGTSWRKGRSQLGPTVTQRHRGRGAWPRHEPFCFSLFRHNSCGTTATLWDPTCGPQTLTGTLLPITAKTPFASASLIRSFWGLSCLNSSPSQGGLWWSDAHHNRLTKWNYPWRAAELSSPLGWARTTINDIQFTHAFTWVEWSPQMNI